MEETQGKHRMNREEFIERMQRDAIRKQTGDAESEQERKEREQREENRKARIYGNQ